MQPGEQPSTSAGTLRLPEKLFAAALGYLALAWVAVIVVDFMGIGGWRGERLSELTGVPLLFMTLFGEAGPTEILQWSCQAAAMVLLLREARRPLEPVDPRRRRAAGAGLAGLTLMFLEDTLNVRHFLAREVVGPAFGVAGENNFQAIATELTFYAVIGGAMVLFFVLAIGVFRDRGRGATFLIIGFGAYGLASVASATRHIKGWYTGFGNLMMQMLSPEGIREYDAWLRSAGLETDIFTAGFFFMDHPVEETIELLGAVSLLCAVLYLRYGAHGQPSRGSDPTVP